MVEKRCNIGNVKRVKNAGHEHQERGYEHVAGVESGGSSGGYDVAGLGNHEIAG